MAGAGPVAAGPGAGDPATLSVVTWNLWWRFGDWSARLDAITSVLADLDPDVVALQEVWHDGERSSASLLAEWLGRHWVGAWSPIPDRWRAKVAGVDEFGCAILSRWPLREARSELLPEDPGRVEGRRVLHAVTDTPYGTLPVFTTHLTSRVGATETRMRQVETVAAMVASVESMDLMPVVTGDFNALPDSDEIRRFEGMLTAPIVDRQVLTDAWRWHTGDDRRGITWSRRNPHVLASLEPDLRIDYVFVGRRYPGRLGHVVDARVVGDQPVDGVWPSDHFAVQVWLHAD